MSDIDFDVIDRLAGLAASAPLAAIRAARTEARDNAQKSYLALFAPEVPGTVLAEERFALAYFVAGLHRDDTAAAFYRDALAPLARPGLIAALSDEIGRAEASGPYGSYPPGPLSAEDAPGLRYRLRESHGAVLARLGPALEHAHLLVFRPREASPAALQALLDAGWSSTDIVTLSQLVSFLAFQLRVVAGLRALAAAGIDRDLSFPPIPISPVAAA